MPPHTADRFALNIYALPAWFLLFLLLAVGMTWPIAGQMGTHIPGSEGDAFVHLWTFNWVKTALANGQNPYFTKLLFYPSGVSLVQHNFAWFHIALWLPLQALMGEGAAYSTIFLAGFAFTGLTTMVLSKRLTGSTAAAFTAGFIAAFWPYILSHHNHPNLIFIGFVPLALYAIDQLLEKPDRRHVLRLTIMLSLIGIVRWQQFVYAAPLLIGFWLCRWFVFRRHGVTAGPWWRDPRLARTAAAIGWSALIMTPFLLPLLAPFFNPAAEFSGLDSNELATGYTDLLAYFTPSRYHPLWGDWALIQTENFIINRVFTPYLGVTVVALAIVAISTRWRQVSGWVLMAGTLAILGLGSTLTFNGQTLIPLPFSLFEDSFLAAIIRRTDRFNVVLSIPIALTAAYGVQVIQNRVRSNFRPLVTVGLLALITLEYITVYPTFALTTPGWYTDVLPEVDTAAVLDLPMHNRSYDEYYMYYQLQHGRPMVGGHVSRPPAAAFDFINSVPLLAGLDFTGEPPTDVPNVGRQLQTLSEHDIEVVVLHKQFLDEVKLAAWRQWLIISPLYEDQDVVVYKTALDGPQNWGQSQTAAAQVSVVRGALSAAQVGPEGRLTAEVVWGATGSLEDEKWESVCFFLIDPARSDQPLGCQPLAPGYPPSGWATTEIFHATYELGFSPFLEGGDFQLVARPAVENVQSDGDLLVGAVTVDGITRDFDPPSPQRPLTYSWDNGVELVGVDQLPNALTFYWHAADRIESSAVLFVHMIDPDSGEIVWQHDAIPRNWTYPTTWWESGEFISETVTWPPEIAADQLQIYVGFGDIATADRLPVRDGAGAILADDRVGLSIDN